MLNISHNKLNKKVDLSSYKSVQKVFHKRHFKHFNRFLLMFAITGIIIMFLPWTQNINSPGSVTTLTPDQRPQTIQSPIPGRIEKWYVKEGDRVKKGDTILFISEIKNEYFDPNLVNRTGQQIKAKEASVNSYGSKVNSLNNQIGAIQNERKLKLQQTQNKLLQAKLKVKSDSIDFEATKIDLKIAERQIGAIQRLYDEGLKSLTELEEKRSKFQEKQAKLISQENKYLASKNEVINAMVEINRVQAEYIDKISKAESDKFTAQSNQYDAVAQVTKLESDFTNYEIRNNLYYKSSSRWLYQ